MFSVSIHTFNKFFLFPQTNCCPLTNQATNSSLSLSLSLSLSVYCSLSLSLLLSPLTDPNSGSSRDWARLIGIPLAFTFELRDKGLHGFELPEDQIKPACEEAYAGVRSIITYAHDKAFHITTPNTAATVIATIWTVLLAVCLTSAPLL